MLFMPIIFLYFTDNGLDMKSIMVLQAIFSISVAILEVPSGYFSDVMGRKKTLIISGIFGTAGFAIFAFAETFWVFVIAEILLGIAQSLSSGTDSALLYDSLSVLEREDEYLSHEGRIGASGNFAEGFAALIGGQLALLGLRYPYYGQVMLSIIGVIVALTLIEPPRSKSEQQAGGKQILEVLNWTFREQKALRWYIFLYAFIGLTTLTCAWFAQPYFKFVKMPLPWYGYVWAALQFTVGIFSWFVEALVRPFSRQTLGYFLVLSLALCFIVLSQLNALWAIVFIFFIYILRGIMGPYFKTIINEKALPEFRATILSLNGLAVRLLFAIISPLLGWVMDLYSIQHSLLCSGIIMLVSGVFVLLQLKWINEF